MSIQFGAKSSKEDLKRYSLSKNFKDGKFQNLSETSLNISLREMPKMLKEAFSGRKARGPLQNLDVIAFDESKFAKDGETKFVWYGHSVALLQLANKNILVDPMFGSDASPIGPMRTKRYSSDTLEIIDTLPEIDFVLLTHDHYDHVDLDSILKLQPKVKQWYVALGLARHMKKWGFDMTKVKEFDWWDEHQHEDIQLVYTPTRHSSGRGLRDRDKCLWGGWVLKSDSGSIYWSGDGGYDDHFKTIGEKYGPFDLGFMECGQYNEKWHHIHMYPEESVQAAIDAKVNRAIPVHWAGFTLAIHGWKEPVERFVAGAKEKGQSYMTPKLGEVSRTDSETKEWWVNYQ